MGVIPCGFESHFEQFPSFLIIFNKNLIKIFKTPKKTNIKKNSRDDFDPKDAHYLSNRVNGRCSNPDCRAGTRGPTKNDSSMHSHIGVAAHITAASPGGPRYDPKLSSEERKSIDNGIYLCENYAKRIDNNKGIDFSVETLREWKKLIDHGCDIGIELNFSYLRGDILRYIMEKREDFILHPFNSSRVGNFFAQHHEFQNYKFCIEKGMKIEPYHLSQAIQNTAKLNADKASYLYFIKQLLDIGLDPNQLPLAKQTGCPELAELLLEYGAKPI